MSAAGEKVAPLVEQLSARIIRNVCELPDYTSPDDQPDLITCTVDELDACVMRAIESSDFNALLTQRDALEAREKVLVEKLAIAREFVRLRWRHLPDCPEAGSHPGAVDIQRCNCGLKFALADLGADNTNSVCSPISGEPWEKLAKGHEAVASLRGEEIERLCAREKVLLQRVAELEPAAECWNALCASYRITCMGSAGLIEPMEGGYAHATFNLWTHRGPDPDRVHDAQDAQGRTRLDQYVMVALDNYRALLSPGEPQS